MHKENMKKIKVVIAFTAALLAIIFIIDYSTTVLKLIYPLKYEKQVFEYARKNDIDPYLVFAMIKAESSFDPKATSSMKAKGLMQITDQTGIWGAQTLGMKDFVVGDLYTPEVNIKIGCWYIRQLMREFNNNLDLVIAAYNGGSGNVKEWLKDRKLSYSGDYLDNIPFKETERFLKKVKNYHVMYRRLYERDF